jgi:hypothetical protein
MRVILDFAAGREVITVGDSVTVTAFGIFSGDRKIAHIGVTGLGEITWIATQSGQPLGSVTVEK